MSQITNFYSNFGPDIEGRHLLDILQWNNEEMEYSHSWVQWLFPLPEPSNFNPDAPLLTEDDIKIFKANPTIQTNLHHSFIRYFRFFGLEYVQGEVLQTEAFEPILFKFANHNWFRITRVLRSCRLLGLENEAVAFYKFLKKIHEENGWVSDNSFSYWTEAVELHN